MIRNILLWWWITEAYVVNSRYVSVLGIGWSISCRTGVERWTSEAYFYTNFCLRKRPSCLDRTRSPRQTFVNIHLCRVISSEKVQTSMDVPGILLTIIDAHLMRLLFRGDVVAIRHYLPRYIEFDFVPSVTVTKYFEEPQIKIELGNNQSHSREC